MHELVTLLHSSVSSVIVRTHSFWPLHCWDAQKRRQINQVVEFTACGTCYRQLKGLKLACALPAVCAGALAPHQYVREHRQHG